jgi:ADP-ribose pyrophosphatase YjhB (NUDIX family)
MNFEEVNYCLRCGTELIQANRYGRVRPVCPACNWVFFADPKVAAAVLVERDGRVLLVRRSIEPARGLWTLPAGFIDAGEDPVLAAKRECFEETGLQVEISELLTVLFGQEHSRGAHIILFYLAAILTGELQAGDDVARAELVPRDELPPLAFSTTKRVLELSA